jgi:phosphate transport system substrate-binding protein
LWRQLFFRWIGLMEASAELPLLGVWPAIRSEPIGDLFVPAAYVRSTCLTLAFTLLAVCPARAAEFAAAGGQFLSSAYIRWGEGYQQATGVRLRYAPVGSATGVSRLRKRAVIFATSAIPLKPSELEASRLVQFPMAIGGVVPVVNLPGIEPCTLVLDGPTLGRIFARKITRWNDRSIKALNPTLPLPARRIVPIYPTGNSGVDFLFSSYLTDVSQPFRAWSRSSTGKAHGRSRAGADASSIMRRTPGALGYVEFARAQASNLACVRLINRDGKLVAPNTSGFRAAAANADWRKLNGYHAVLTNRPGPESWPITGASFALMHRDVASGPAAGEALRFFDWAYNRGVALDPNPDYEPLSSDVVAAIQQTWRTSILKANRPLWLVK